MVPTNIKTFSFNFFLIGGGGGEGTFNMYGLNTELYPPTLKYSQLPWEKQLITPVNVILD